MEELGLEGDIEKSIFMPTHPASLDEVQFYSKKLKCVDKENYKIFGDYNSYKASQFNVQFLKCNKDIHPDVECKSDAEITEFIRGKFMMLVFNQVRFDSSQYGHDSIISESKLQWVPVNSQIQQTVPFKISTTLLFLQDEDINLDDLTEI